jgi:hypothetical protein
MEFNARYHNRLKTEGKAFLYSNEQTEKEHMETIPFAIASKKKSNT